MIPWRDTNIFSPWHKNNKYWCKHIQKFDLHQFQFMFVFMNNNLVFYIVRLHCNIGGFFFNRSSVSFPVVQINIPLVRLMLLLTIIVWMYLNLNESYKYMNFILNNCNLIDRVTLFSLWQKLGGFFLPLCDPIDNPINSLLKNRNCPCYLKKKLALSGSSKILIKPNAWNINE